MTAGVKANVDGSAAIQVGGTDVIGLDSTGNINFPVSGQRITGDFSNATVANRVMFQTSTVNGNTLVGAIPNGTATASAVVTFNAADPGNASRLSFQTQATEAQIVSTFSGTGTYLPMTFYTGGSERLRIDTAGITKFRNTGSAYDSTPGDGVSDGLYLQVDSSGIAHIDSYAGSGSTNLAFGTNSGGGAVSERMRIDSSGNLLVGTSNTSATAGVGMKFIFSADANNPVVKTVVQDSSGVYSCYNLYSTNSGAYRFYVTTAGVINATSTTITGISDQRLKENIRDLNYGLSELLLVKPRRFDWKDGKGQDKKDAAGFIAQEFEQVFPNSVSTSLAGEDGIEYKTLCHEELIPTMVRAIQEQQQMIETLQAKVAALEGA